MLSPTEVNNYNFSFTNFLLLQCTKIVAGVILLPIVVILAAIIIVVIKIIAVVAVVVVDFIESQSFPVLVVVGTGVVIAIIIIIGFNFLVRIR
jgi:hypothetical protein